MDCSHDNTTTDAGRIGKPQESAKPIDDGGPAFPLMNSLVGSLTSGMSLRDWFAGQACVPMVAQWANEAAGAPKDIASDAYRIADAMLAARKRVQS